MKHLILFATILAVVSGKYNGPTNQAGVNLIKEFEGFRANFYSDPVGVRTIGYGHACLTSSACKVPLNGKYSVPLTRATGEALLKSDLGSYEKCVTSSVTFGNLNANQYSALVSFTFNLGCGSLKSSQLLKKLNQGNPLGASQEFKKWVNAGGKPLPGLVRRREAERVLFCSGGGCGGSPSPSNCVGTVTANPSLIIRKSASTSAANMGAVPKGQKVTITGRVSGTVVNGNPYWFKVSQGYLSAAYITINQGSQTWCRTK